MDMGIYVVKLEENGKTKIFNVAAINSEKAKERVIEIALGMHEFVNPTVTECIKAY
jgi:hypothetical protein